MTPPIDSAFGLDAFAEDDEAAPELTDIDPAPGTVLVSSSVFRFTVADDTSLDVLRVEVRQGAWEVVYEEGAFTQAYRNLSTVTTQADGSLRFAIRRSTGWTKDPVGVRVRLTDTEGNEA